MSPTLTSSYSFTSFTKQPNFLAPSMFGVFLNSPVQNVSLPDALYRKHNHRVKVGQVYVYGKRRNVSKASSFINRTNSTFLSRRAIKAQRCCAGFLFIFCFQCILFRLMKNESEFNLVLQTEGRSVYKSIDGLP